MKNMLQKSGAFVGSAFSKLQAVAFACMAFAVALMALSGEASAAIDTTEVETAITSGVTIVEGLIGAGLALLVVFLTAKIIRKGVSKVG